MEGSLRVVGSASSSCVGLVTALLTPSLVWVSVPLLQPNLPWRRCSAAARPPACLPHCPWMADARPPALSPPEDDWNVGKRQKPNVMIQVKETRVCVCVLLRSSKERFVWR